jgi:hypothetical protein
MPACTGDAQVKKPFSRGGRWIRLTMVVNVWIETRRDVHAVGWMAETKYEINYEITCGIQVKSDD